MKYKELDVVILKDGRQATILEVFHDAYMGEVADEYGQTLDTPIIKDEDIQNVIYIHNK